MRALKCLSAYFGCSSAHLSAEQLQQFRLEGIDRCLSQRSSNTTVATMKMIYSKALRCSQRVKSLSKQLLNPFEEKMIGILILANLNITLKLKS